MLLEAADEKIAMKHLLQVLTVVIATCSAGCGGDDSNVQEEREAAVRGIRAAGALTPEDAPGEPPVRIDAGGSCVVDVKQSYTISGTLTGSVEVDFRILVAGPCGSPAGTFDEEWIAHGEFNGAMNGTAAEGRFNYVARVRAGGDVEGTIQFGQGLAGELTVHGNFGEGRLSYDGWVDQE